MYANCSYYPYLGDIRVEFQDSGEEIFATFGTRRLFGKSVQHLDFPNFHKLFANPKTIINYGSGQSWDREKVREIFMKFVDRWEKERNPFSAFVFYNTWSLSMSNWERSFVGIAVVDECDRLGQLELGGFGRKKAWCGQGVSSEGATLLLWQEAAAALIHGILPEAVRRGYTVGGKPLDQIFARFKYYNSSSTIICDNLGMSWKSDEKDDLHTATRVIDVNQLGMDKLIKLTERLHGDMDDQTKFLTYRT